MQSVMLLALMAALPCMLSAASEESWSAWQRNLRQIDDGLHIEFAEGQSNLFIIEEGQSTTTVVINASPSHTHRSGANLEAFYWREASTGALLARGPSLTSTSFPVGEHTVTLTIQDNFGDTLSQNFSFTVALLTKVPGTLLRLYPGDNPAVLTGSATFGLVTKNGRSFEARGPDLPATATNFLVRMQGNVIFPANAVIRFEGLTAASKPWLYIDRRPYTQGITPTLSPGRHYVEFRCFMVKRTTVSLVLQNSKLVPLPSVDLSNIAPIIHRVISDSPKPGQPGEISGFLLDGTSLFISGTNVVGGANTIESFGAKTFVWPARPAGANNMYVIKNSNGKRSNTLSVNYPQASISQDFGGPFSNDIKFVATKIPVAPGDPNPTWVTRMVFCHGAIYTSFRRNGLPGQIWKLVVDDDYNVLSRVLIVQVPEPMSIILGLACDPWDSDSSFKLYFTHSKLPPSGGLFPTPPGYQAAVSYVNVNGPAPRNVVAVIRNIGVSNHDHAANALAFLHDGRLLVATSGNTNAGIPHIRLGNLDEGPTVGLILVADIRNPGYNGKLTYSFLPNAPLALRSNPALAQSQIYTSWVKCDNEFVKPFIYGARVPFGMIVGLTGQVHLNINGPNDGWGGEMIGLDPVTKEPIPRFSNPNTGPQTADGLWYNVKEGCYLGHPNLALCRGGHKPSCKFIALTERSPPAGFGFCRPQLIMPPAATGLLEYESHAFGGAYKHHLFVADYLKSSWRYNPKADVGQPDSASAGTYPHSIGLDFFQAPGGVHLLSQYDDGGGPPQTSSFVFNKPFDAVLAANGKPSIYDIVPNKGSKSQPSPNTFIIGGENFDKMTGPVTVMFGSAQAQNVQVVGKKWIKGYIPSNPAGGCPMALQVKYGSTTINMPGVFCYLNPMPPVKAPPLVR